MKTTNSKMEVDVWVRGSDQATTTPLTTVSDRVASWTDSDVRALLMEMLRALERAQNPDGDVLPISLRGFSWIVSPSTDGVLVHVEMQIGTASAGPFAIGESQLTEMIGRVMSAAPKAVVH